MSLPKHLVRVFYPREACSLFVTIFFGISFIKAKKMHGLFSHEIVIYSDLIYIFQMQSAYLETPWDCIWIGGRKDASVEELCAQCMGFEKWDPPFQMDEPFIHNVVSTSKVYSRELPINLHRLSVLLKNSTYDKKRFAAITIRTRNPLCTALLFTSGKLVVTGVQSFYECIMASLVIMRIINSAYPMQNFRVHDCIIQNMVAHSSFNIEKGKIFNIQVIVIYFSNPIGLGSF